MNWSIDKKINVGFVLALALLIVIGLVSFFSIHRLTDTIRLLTYSHAVVDTLEDLFSHLKDAQRGERGFVLTGEERYLEPYRQALSMIDDELAELRRLVARDVSQRGRLATLEAGVIDNLAELDEAITLRRSEGFDAAVQAIRSGEGKHQMDSLGKIIVDMQADEEGRLRGRSQLAENRALIAMVTIAGSGLAAVGLMFSAMLFFNRDITERKRAERGLQVAHDKLEEKVEERTAELVQANEDLNREVGERKRSEAQLSVTLEQIEKSRDDLQFIFDQLRVGTVMIDGHERISFASKNTRALFGMRTKDVIGRRWSEVLPVDEEDKDAISAMSQLTAGRRARVPVGMESRDGNRYAMEIEVLDDPRMKNGRIFSIYDMSEIYDLRRLLDEKAQFKNMIGKSNLMRRAFQQIQDVARVDSTVLIEGETGTGKELVAGALHSASYRKDKPFVPVNCAGLTDALLASQLFGHRKGAFTGAVADQKGLFEAAEGGTLFLDEIGDISMAVQTSLLRVLQEKEMTRLGDTRPVKIDVRVIAATHRNLTDEIDGGRFRADLFYRLRVARIEVPPLRARREDIPLLAEWFLRQSRATTGKPVHEMSGEAMRTMMDYHWPGNVRELKSAIEFAVIHCKGKILRMNDLPPEIGLARRGVLMAAEPAPADSMEEEQQRLLAALEKAGGNRAAAARLLGIGRTTLYRRLADLGIRRP